MPEAAQFSPDRLRVVLDHGEVVELDGGTLVLAGEESASVVLRLTPWRALAVARVLEEWSAMSRVFSGPARPPADEVELSRVLEMAASALGEGGDPVPRFERGARTVPGRQRLAAVAVLTEQESRLTALQRLALVDAAAWWLTDPAGGTDLAWALLAAACTSEATIQRAYLALVTPADEPHGEQPEDPSL